MMTEKQKLIEKIMKGVAYKALTWYINKRLLRKVLNDNLPQESTYESGYSEWHKIWTDVWYRECAMDLEKKWLTYESGYQKEILKLKKSREKTLRKKKWCSYEEERCMLTIINDLKNILLK